MVSYLVLAGDIVKGGERADDFDTSIGATLVFVGESEERTTSGATLAQCGDEADRRVDEVDA